MVHTRCPVLFYSQKLSIKILTVFYILYLYSIECIIYSLQWPTCCKGLQWSEVQTFLRKLEIFFTGNVLHCLKPVLIIIWQHSFKIGNMCSIKVSGDTFQQCRWSTTMKFCFEIFSFQHEAWKKKKMKKKSRGWASKRV